MKKLILNVLALMVAVFTMTSCDKEELIQADDLPSNATTFLSEHFGSLTISRVQKEKEGLSGTEYNVYLSDGTEVTFDKDGNWKEVDGPGIQPIPTTFILPAIVEYVETNYATASITSIEKNNSTYDVDLTNDLDLVFDHSGNFKRIDN